MSYAIPIGIPIEDLRPTQMTVGLRAVELKRRQWRGADKQARIKLLRRHVLPAVIGSKQRPFIIDYHYCAHLKEGAGLVAVFVVVDLHHLPKREFWTYLDGGRRGEGPVVRTLRSCLSGLMGSAQPTDGFNYSRRTEPPA